jgi:hypothetical protein
VPLSGRYPLPAKEGIRLNSTLGDAKMYIASDADDSGGDPALIFDSVMWVGAPLTDTTHRRRHFSRTALQHLRALRLYGSSSAASTLP